LFRPTVSNEDQTIKQHLPIFLEVIILSKEKEKVRSWENQVDVAVIGYCLKQGTFGMAFQCQQCVCEYGRLRCESEEGSGGRRVGAT
jgi:hypothetical protein